MLRLRDKLLPLVQLGKALDLDVETETPNFVMVIQVGDQRYGLLVNDVLDTEEIVVKPLANILRSVEAFSGATILGDGSVILILDPNAMAERAGDLLDEHLEEGTATVDDSLVGEKTAMLLFQSGGGAPKAVELSHITRLEHIEADKIERANGRTAIQYRGRLMPIMTPDYNCTVATEGVQPLLVEDHLNIELSADRSGVRGTAVIAGKACEILDVDYYKMNGLAEHIRTDNTHTEKQYEEELVA